MGIVPFASGALMAPAVGEDDDTVVVEVSFLFLFLDQNDIFSGRTKKGAA